MIRHPAWLTAVVVIFLGPVVAAAAAEPVEPLFTRHVVPLFSRLGCNAGLCHGAVR
jgi:hypothetical protein